MSTNTLQRTEQIQELGLSLDSLDLTDLGNAQRFVMQHGREVRYVHAWNSFLVWDGVRWRRDDSGEVMRRAAATMMQIHDELKQVRDTSERRELFQRLQRCLSAPRLRSMIELVKSETGIPVRPEELDSNPWLLNVKNGTIDLRVVTPRPHDPADLITKLAPVTYDLDAKAPTWAGFLDKVFAGNKELIGFLQRAIGYSLTGDTGERAMFILHGTGANGKSRFLNAIDALMGDYSQPTRPESLMVKRSGAPTNDIAALAGARFVHTSETEAGSRLAEVQVKQLTGGDKVVARFLYREYSSFTPQAKFFLATNHRPEIKGTDDGIWDRLVFVPFSVRIPPEDRDLELGTKLQAELDGILLWALEGLKEWHEKRLSPPTTVKSATNTYRSEMDLLGNFLDERTLRERDLSTQLSDVYREYSEWCVARGEQPGSSKQLAAKLRDRGFEVRSSTGNKTFVFGLTVTPPSHPI